MTQPFPIPAFALGAAALLCLASCTANFASRTTAAPANATEADLAAVPEKVEAPPVSNTPTPETSIAQATGSLLSPEQKAQLIQLPIPIVAPTDLPAGFRLVDAGGEAGKYANGADDSGYSIRYVGDDDTCLSIASSKDGPRRLPKQGQVETKLGSVAVYTHEFRGETVISSFLPVKGNPVLLSGGIMPGGAETNGEWKTCKAVSMETYVQVLRSLEVLK